MKSDHAFAITFTAFVILLLLIGFIGWAWSYRQAELWRSQGVQITTLDVLMGIRPAGTPSAR